MPFYSEHIFPFLMDRFLSHHTIMALRRKTLANAYGQVLEIGFGSGLNFSCYPNNVQGLHIVEPSAGMNRIAKKRISKSPIKIHSHILKGEHLPFDRSTFDTVVTTFTLCSVQDPERVIREIRRVLKSGCYFLFLEHGLSPDRGVARWQKILNPIQKCVAAGCHLNRPMTGLIEQAGFKMRHMQNYYYNRAPKALGYFYQGMARK